MLVQCTKFKAQHSQFFSTTHIRHSAHGVFDRPYGFISKLFVKYVLKERSVLLNGTSYSCLFLRPYCNVLPIGNSA